MQPAHLARLVTSLAVAADLVEAIDDPDLRFERDWDLAVWDYELVPWGVHFFRLDGRGGVFVSIPVTPDGGGLQVTLLGATVS